MCVYIERSIYQSINKYKDRPSSRCTCAAGLAGFPFRCLSPVASGASSAAFGSDRGGGGATSVALTSATPTSDRFRAPKGRGKARISIYLSIYISIYLSIYMYRSSEVLTTRSPKP